MAKDSNSVREDGKAIKAAYIAGIFVVIAALISALVPDIRKAIVRVIWPPVISAGDWRGSGKDQQFKFSSNKGCLWDATIATISLSAKIAAAGRLESGHLAYRYTEDPKTPGCGTGQGAKTGTTNNSVAADLTRSTVSGDQVHLVFPGAGITFPETQSDFIGRLTEENTIQGFLNINRTDWPQLGVDWKVENIKVTLEK